MAMPYSVEYFNQRVLAEIADWPVGVLADYARLVELLMEFGPDLRMRHIRAPSAAVSSSSARVAARASAGHCTATSSVSG